MDVKKKTWGFFDPAAKDAMLEFECLDMGWPSGVSEKQDGGYLGAIADNLPTIIELNFDGENTDKKE